jgi:hypothetical protein
LDSGHSHGAALGCCVSRFTECRASSGRHHGNTGKQTEKGREVYQLKLTPEQQAEVRELTGQQAEALSLTVKELEERIHPQKGIL